MGARPISPEQKGAVMVLLRHRYSFSMIMKKMKEMKMDISHGSIAKIKKNMINMMNVQEPLADVEKIKVKRTKKRHVFKKLDGAALRKLAKWTSMDRHPTQDTMAAKLHVTPRAVRYHIKYSLASTIKKKPKVHTMWHTALMKRKLRSWKLYRSLANGRYKNVITTDEAWFHLADFNKPRTTFYSKIGMVVPTARRPPHHSKGLMAWAGVSSNGKTRLRWVEPGAKINSEYYINRVLKPFIKNDVHTLYPDGNFIFHQDSAPAHKAASTVQFLEKSGINFIREKDWMPCSPDAAPMDYGIWNWMKERIKDRRARTLKGLKKIVEQVWSELPQSHIDATSKAWPKYVYRVYKEQGRQIQHLRRKKYNK